MVDLYLIVDDPASAVAWEEQLRQDLLNFSGVGLVDYLSSTAAAPGDVGSRVVVHAGTTAQAWHITTTAGVLAINHSIWNDLNLATTDGSAQGGAKGVVAQQHPITAGLGANGTEFDLLSANLNKRIITAAEVGGGCDLLIQPLNHPTKYTVAAYNAGASLVAGTAAGRRVLFGTYDDNTYTGVNANTLLLLEQAVDWLGPSSTGIAVAGPDQDLAAGAPFTLTAAGSKTAAGADVVDGDGTWTQPGGTPTALSSTTAVSPTGTAPSPANPITLTYRYTVDNDSDDVNLSVAAASANEKPVVESAVVSPSTAAQGDAQTVTITASDPDGTIAAYRHTPSAGLVMSGTTAAVGTVDTSATPPGEYTDTVDVQDNSGAWSEPVVVSLAVVAVGDQVGEDIQFALPIASRPGVATIVVEVESRAVGGGDLGAGDAVAADRIGIVTEGPWRPGGDVNVEV